jgi:hypothetical protein
MSKLKKLITEIHHRSLWQIVGIFHSLHEAEG